MKSFLIAALLFVCHVSSAQQTSHISLDSSSHNKLTVQQSGIADSQLSDINAKKSGGNEISVKQSTDSLSNKQEPVGFMQNITNTQAIVTLISAIIALGVTLLSIIRKKRK